VPEEKAYHQRTGLLSFESCVDWTSCIGMVQSNHGLCSLNDDVYFLPAR
jgi:hypothetical protein